MSTIAVLTKSFQFNRVRTLAVLDRVEKEPNPEAVLGWRPGIGRAHTAWQIMHIGVTEEIFATERLSPERPPYFTDLWPRFRGGSVPDDEIPSIARIREVLEQSRAHLLETLSTFGEDQLTWIPPALKERGLSLRDVLHIICWHEAHHQGQAHITLNLYKNQH